MLEYVMHAVVCSTLYVRYTNAVGPYISSISSCLKDKDPGVNKTTFISLTRLLQEDFLKWRGSLFYRFISCIVSEDADVAELGKLVCFCCSTRLAYYTECSSALIFPYSNKCLIYCNVDIVILI